MIKVSLLIIGSTVADVIVNVPHLPRTGEDVHVISQQLSLGGCAYNVFHTARLLGAEAMLFSPIGSGLYGDFVFNELKGQGIASPIPRLQALNGCCYCLVDEEGERTFLCHRGAEYHFKKEWLDALDVLGMDGVYLCGLEAEEADNQTLIDFLRESRLPFWFAPGPRITVIPPQRMADILSLRPRLHLNRQEALAFTGASDAASAAQALHRFTGNDVVITLGPEGALCLHGGEEQLIRGQAVQVVDTIGAGDSHLGAIMAGMAKGLSLFEASALANRVSALVVAQSGACLASLPEGF